MYGAEELIKAVEGLNSISTLHRWRKYAEKLCNARFKQRTMQTGKSSFTKVYQFSDADMAKFQQVAELRNKGQPIKEVIVQVFAVEKQTTQQEDKNLLFENLIEVTERMDKQLDELVHQVTHLNKRLISQGQEVYQLKERVLELEYGKLDKPFYRKKP